MAREGARGAVGISPTSCLFRAKSFVAFHLFATYTRKPMWECRESVFSLVHGTIIHARGPAPPRGVTRTSRNNASPLCDTPNRTRHLHARRATVLNAVQNRVEVNRACAKRCMLNERIISSSSMHRTPLAWSTGNGAFTPALTCTPRPLSLMDD